MRKLQKYFCLLLVAIVHSGASGQLNQFESIAPGAYPTTNAIPGWTIESSANTSPGLACNAGLNWVPGSPEFSVVATPIYSVAWNLIPGTFNIDNQTIPNSPLGGNNIVRLNSTGTVNIATRIRTTFPVTAANSMIRYAFCGSWDGSAHTCCDQPGFYVKVYDCLSNFVSCSSTTVTPYGGWAMCGPGTPILFFNGAISWTNNWQVRSIDLSAMIGSCATIEVINSKCAYGNHHGTAYFDADLSGFGILQSNYCPNSGQAVLQGPPGFTSYQWYAPGNPPVPVNAWWGGNAASASITPAPLVGTVYTLQAVNANGCIYTKTVAVQTSSVSIAGIWSNASCAGGANGSASVQASGSGIGYNYAWYAPGNVNPVSYSASAPNLAPGIYTVNVSAQGFGSPSCGVASATVVVGSNPYNFIANYKSYCGNTAYLNNLPGGSNYQWYNGNTLIPANLGGTAQNYTASPVSAGSVFHATYQSNLGCKDSVKFILSQIPNGSLTVTYNQMACPGSSTGVVAFSLSPAVASTPGASPFSIYNLPGMSTFSSITYPAGNTATVNNLLAGNTYSAAVFDGTCLYSTSFTVNLVPGNFSVSVASCTLCPGTSVNAGIVFSNSVLATQFTYSWTPTTNLLGNAGNVQTALITPTTPPLGTMSTIIYTIVVSPTVTSCPMTRTLSVSIVNFQTPSITAIPGLCKNSPSYTINANPPGGTFSNIFSNNSINPLTGVITPSLANPGFNSLSYSMPGNCVAQANSTFAINAVPVLTLSPNTSICTGNSGTITASGAESYFWNTGATSNQIVVSPLVNTVYSVYGTYTNTGCSSNTKSVSITVLVSPTLSIQGSTILCEGESTSLDPTGADFYKLDGGSIIVGPVTLSPITTTTYTFTGFKNNGCKATRTVEVLVSPCTKINEYEEAEASIRLYPNPSSGLVTLETALPCEITVYDALGRVVLKDSFTVLKNTMDLNHVANGVYSVRIKDRKQEVLLKLVKTTP